MYIPKHFDEPRINVMQTLIRDYPLATLVTLSAKGLNTNHIPLHWVEGDGSPYDSLRGHIARSNPLWIVFAGSIRVRHHSSGWPPALIGGLL